MTGSAAAVAAQVPQRRMPDVQRIDPGRQTAGTGTEARQEPDPDQSAAARDIAALRRELQARDMPGPPPTFEVSLLEVESDLRHILARIEAARTQEREGAAVQATRAEDDIAATPDAPPPAADTAPVQGPDIDEAAPRDTAV